MFLTAFRAEVGLKKLNLFISTRSVNLLFYGDNAFGGRFQGQEDAAWATNELMKLKGERCAVSNLAVKGGGEEVLQIIGCLQYT